VLATVMLMAGAQKLARTKQQLLAPTPAALDVVPIFTALAATGVVLFMLGAAATHLRRGERQMLPINLTIAAVALFIAIERFGPHSL